MHEDTDAYLTLIQTNTEFKTPERAKAVVAALKWLDDGAPEHLDRLGGTIRFDMLAFINEYPLSEDPDVAVKGCGTACCIAGAIHIAESGGYHQINTFDSMPDIFNIEDWNSDLYKLFLCRDSGINLDQVTSSGAATTLRRYIDTGRVVWLLGEQN